MRITLAPWGETIAELVRVARDAESAGFDRVWTSEFARSAFVPATAIAASTTSIGVGTAIALAFVRSPLVTSLTALDLDELASGRFVLGLGTGVKRHNADWHGTAFDPAAQRMRETINVIRAVCDAALDGETIDAGGDIVRLSMRGFRRPHPHSSAPMRIHLAAVGPRMLATAAAVADGWIAHELGSPAHLRDVILPALAPAVRRPFEVVASACCVIDDDRAAARRRARPTIAFYASVKTYEAFFASHGFGGEVAAIREAHRAGDNEAMHDAVTDAMVDAFCICGNPDDVRREVERYDGLADSVKLSPPTHHTADEDIRTSQRRILETFAT